ncbi:hypothetical protein LOAG_11171 [Loa loa]|uniref:Uncharacterized protein n=1 Tax=Loa loa TaxID=7209 RepID=A0A1S0TNE3_LOALO|nr:hypothetical protein LOAG_11171 [Loa loa]EFO17329.1 hypothetical protein LOAG_11171 [Loa loa]
MVQESCQLDRVAVNEYLSKESNGKEIQYLTKPEESVAKILSNETVTFAENANNSIKQVETVAQYSYYNDKQQHTLLNIFSKIDAILILGAVLSIVISCVMVTIEIRNYKLYQLAKSKPVRPILTREFLERIRIERYNAKGRGQKKQEMEK